MSKISKYQILLVDDEPKVLSALRRTLRNEKYLIETFEKPKEAILYAKTTPIDLVISDYRMPEMNGVTLLTHLKELQPNMVMIVLSGYVDMPAVLTAINEIGIDKYLTKPWKDDELQAILEEALSPSKKTVEVQSVESSEVKFSKAVGALAKLEVLYPGITQGNWSSHDGDWKKTFK